MAAMAAAMLAAPVYDVIAKLLTSGYSPGQVGLARFGVQTVLLAGVLLASGARPRPPTAAHGLAGAMIALSVLLYVWSLRYLPVATAVAIFFLAPLLVLALSHLALDDRMDRRRLAAVLVGFAGALLAIRPSWRAFGWVALLPLGSAACYALYVVLTKSLVGAESRAGLQLRIAAAASAALILAMLAGSALGEPLLSARLPRAGDWIVFAAMGVVWTLVHLLVATALSLAPASALAPLQYLEIIGATLLGFAVFGALPDVTTWLGAALIVGAGLYAIRAER